MSQRSSLKNVFPSIGSDLGKKEKPSNRGGVEEGNAKTAAEKSPSQQGKKITSRRSEPIFTNLVSQANRPSAPEGSGRSSFAGVPSIVVSNEKSSKLASGGRSSSLERTGLLVPESGAGRRHSDVWRPGDGALTVSERHLRPGSSEMLNLDRNKSTSASCLRLSREDLASLRELDLMEDVKHVKLDITKIQSELRSEFEVEKMFRVAYRQKFDPRGISCLASPNPLTSLGPTSAAASAACNEYLPLRATELREIWRVQSAGDGKGEIRAIRGMCFTTAGQLAITEEKNSRVQIFNVHDGQSLRVLKETSVSRRMQPAGICQMPHKPILAVADLNRVVFLDHEFKGQWSTEVIVKNKTNLTGVASITRGSLVLTDIGIKPSVGLFETDGRVIREFQADFDKPQGVTVSHELGITFVSDATLGCVYLFDQDGRLLSRLGQTGNDLVRLVYPQGLCCLSAGTCLLVADRAQHRLVVFDIRNHAVDHLLTAADKLNSPICLAGSGDKYLAVSEENQDFKVNDYKLKMFRMKKGNRKQ